MRPRSIFVLGFFLAGVTLAFAQGGSLPGFDPSDASASIRAMKVFAKAPVDLELGEAFLRTLEDPRAEVRREAVVTWRTYAPKYMTELDFELQEKTLDGVATPEDRKVKEKWRALYIERLAVRATDEDPAVAVEALKNLGYLGDVFADSFVGWGVLPHQERMVKPTDPLAKALKKLSQEPSEAFLAALSGIDAQATFGILEALSDEDLARFEAQIRRLLSHPSTDARVAGVVAFSRLRELDRQTALTPMLRDKDASVRSAAFSVDCFEESDWLAFSKKSGSDWAVVRAEAMGHLTGNPDNEPYLRARIQDPDPSVQAAALTAWANMDMGSEARYKEQEAFLRKGIKSPSPDLRYASYRGLLDSLTGDEWRETVGNALRDKDREVRELAAICGRGDGFEREMLDCYRDGLVEDWQVAINFRKPENQPLLAECLASKDDRLLWLAVSGFYDSNDERLYPLLAKLARSKDSHIRVSAIVQLSSGEDRLAFLTLKGLLDPANEDVFEEAASYIAQRRWPASMDLLRGFAKHKSRHIRVYAKQGIQRYREERVEPPPG